MLLVKICGRTKIHKNHTTGDKARILLQIFVGTKLNNENNYQFCHVFLQGPKIWLQDIKLFRIFEE